MRFKIAVLTLALCGVISGLHSSAVLAQTCAAVQLCGDVNNSGKVTAGDALAVLRDAVGLPGDLTCQCHEHGTVWSWSGTVVGNTDPVAVLAVGPSSRLLLTDVHGTSSAGQGSELRISDSGGLRYVRALNLENTNLKPFDVVFGTALQFEVGTTVTVQTTGGTTQLTLSGLLFDVP